MRLRDIGLALIAAGWLGGNLTASLATRQGFESMAAAGGSANPSDLALASAHSLSFAVGGDLIALAGVAVFVIAAIRSVKLNRGRN